MFPDTPQTLLRKIAELAQGDDHAEWEAFVELYAEPLRGFVRMVNGALGPEEVEDVVQDVFIRLVDVLREGRIDRTKAKFRSYLATMARRLLIDRYREALVRPQGETGADPVASDRATADSVVQADPGVIFDAKWRLAVRAAAIEHVLTKTAVSRQSAEIYRAVLGLDPATRDLTPREIANRFGVTYEVVKQVKSRLDRAVAAVERQMLK